MTTIQALILGMVQGLTEFFPISSSLHLNLASELLSIEKSASLFLFCHLATSFSVLVFFRKEIFILLFKNTKEVLFYFFALVPLVFVYFLFGKVIKSVSDVWLGPFMILTSGILFSLKEKREPVSVPSGQGIEPSSKKKFSDALFIGCAQTLALFPGLSRSAITLFAASNRGWCIKEAFCFSYLLSVPTIWGGCILEYSHIDQVKIIPCIAAFITSFSIGYLALHVVKTILLHKKVFLFGFYCLFLGLVLSIYKWVI